MTVDIYSSIYKRKIFNYDIFTTVFGTTTIYGKHLKNVCVIMMKNLGGNTNGNKVM